MSTRQTAEARKRLLWGLAALGILMLLAAYAYCLKLTLMPDIVRTGVSRAHVAAPVVDAEPYDHHMMAAVSEYWRNDKRWRTLTVYFLEHPVRGAAFSLTEEYMEVVEGPDPSIIAYITRDSENWYQAYVLDSKKKNRRCNGRCHRRKKACPGSLSNTRIRFTRHEKRSAVFSGREVFILQEGTR